jgi:protoheme IX farnesyltransferase
VLLVVATMLPRVIEMSGNFYLGGAIVLGAVFLWYAWKLLDPPDEFFAMKTFQYSIVYLMAAVRLPADRPLAAAVPAAGAGHALPAGRLRRAENRGSRRGSRL